MKVWWKFLNKLFSKKNIILLITSHIFLSISYILSYKIKDYHITLISPIFMILSYFPFALFEKELIKMINNKIISIILLIHIYLTIFLMIVYFIAILMWRITWKTGDGSLCCDEEGNLVSSIDLQDKEEYTFKYNISNKLIKENSITGSKALYSYTSPYNNELRTVTAGGVSSLYTYDDNGNPTSSVK